MTTKAELEEQIAELKTAQATAETLNQVSRDLNAAADEDAMLQALVRPMAEFGVGNVTLIYLDLDQSGKPEWLELTATWQSQGISPIPLGMRFYIPEFPFSRLWMASPDEPQLISDILTDERIDENSRNMLIQTDGLAMAIIPLAQAGRWVGLISMTWREAHAFSPQESKILHGLISQVSPIVENRRLLERTQKALDELQQQRDLLGNALEALTHPFYVIDAQDYTIKLANSAANADATEGTVTCHALTHQNDEPCASTEHPCPLEIVKQTKKPAMVEHIHYDQDGIPRHVEVHGYPIFDDAGNVVQMIEYSLDISGQKQAEAERENLQQEIIEAQQRALQELSTPVIPIMDTPQGGIIVMTLMGSIDSMRARDITRALLAGIRKNRARVVILDITGVPIVDSGVASHLNKTIQAAQLKGARTIVTGISEAVAEAIVDLGIDWGGLDTLADLQTGLLVALNSLGIKLKT